MSRILIVSADEVATEQIRLALPGEMYDLVVATDLGKGLETLDGSDERADVVIFDQRLTQPNSTEKELKRYIDRAGSLDTPVVVLGISRVPADWVGLLHAGAADYVLAAPVDADLLAARIGVQLRLKERLDQLRAEAVMDELTGVHNRRYLDEQLGARLGEAARYDMPFSIGLLDIDHFKRVNDNHGHQVGDQVLRETAAIVRKQMRKEDVLVRYGGEEFAIMLPHTDRLGAAILSERVREAIAEHSYDIDGKTMTITVSIGVASYPLDDCADPEELVGVADKRLYQAKDGGRNQSVFD